MDDSIDLNKTTAGFLALLCGVISAILMSTRHFFIRKYSGTYSAWALGIDTSIIQNAFFCILSVILATNEENPISPRTGVAFEWSLRVFIIGTLSGVVMDFGKTFMGESVVYGMAGPAQALMSTHCLH